MPAKRNVASGSAAASAMPPPPVPPAAPPPHMPVKSPAPADDDEGQAAGLVTVQASPRFGTRRRQRLLLEKQQQQQHQHQTQQPPLEDENVQQPSYDTSVQSPSAPSTRRVAAAAARAAMPPPPLPPHAVSSVHVNPTQQQQQQFIDGAAIAAAASAPVAALAPALGGLDANVAAGAVSGAISEGILTGVISSVRQRAQDWCTLSQRDVGAATREAVGSTLELAGLPVRVEDSDLLRGPQPFLDTLPERVREHGTDLTVYPLLPTAKQGRRAVLSLQRFWAFAIAAHSGVGLLEGPGPEDSAPQDEAGQRVSDGILDSISIWFISMSQAPIRSLRHVASVAALALAEALGHHCQALIRTRDTLQTQLAAPGIRNKRQEAQLQRDAVVAASHADRMYAARSRLLEGTVPPRSRDVCEVIRLHTLCEVDRLMRQDPETYLQNRWTARVFLMVHDPSVEVRLKALGVIHQWYASSTHSPAVQEHLTHFAQRCLSHLVERSGDVDSRVAAAALRCLRLATLAERLENEEFEHIVNLCVGSREPSVREEAALFVNSHVFQDPGICVVPAPTKTRRGGGGAGAGAGGGGDRGGGTGGGGFGPDDENEEDNLGLDGGDGEKDNRDDIRELYNSETSISMLMEFLESYVGNRLRITDRAVNAFWGMAPSLSHWSTMVNLCLVGESHHRVGMDPINPVQRLALLYVMEAAVRKAAEDLHSQRHAEKDTAVKRLNDACAHIIPEMPRLMEVSRPDERQSLLLAHVCKILVEYAVDNSRNQVLMNSKAMCQALMNNINGQTPLDTVKYCTDALVGLSRCFDEAKSVFLELAKTWHHRCVELLAPESTGDRVEELRIAMGRYVVLSNRAIDMTFGSQQLLGRIVQMLSVREAWMRESHEQARDAAAAKIFAEAERAANRSTGIGGDGGEDGADTAPCTLPLPPERPKHVPDARLALQLLEAATTTVMWHVRMAYWVETESTGAGKAQVSDMLQGLGDFAKLRAELPHAFVRLRAICAELVANDRCPYMRFHAFSAYMSLGQYAVGVSEKLNFEVVPEGEEALPGYDGIFNVTMPISEMRALWLYLNEIFGSIADVGAAGLPFDVEGQRVAAMDIYPAPSRGTMTSARYLTQSCMEALGRADVDDEAPLEKERKLLLAVLASRMVQESEIEDVFTGPLAHLLLIQCERSRPRPMREAALGLLRRLRELARATEEHAVLYFRMQAQAIFSMFECCGIEAAHSLCAMLTRQWGPRMLPWLERPLFLVMHDVMLSCITPDKSKFPLLEVFFHWVKGDDFLSKAHAQEISKSLAERCNEVSIPMQTNEVMRRTVQRLTGEVQRPSRPWGQVTTTLLTEASAAQDLNSRAVGGDAADVVASHADGDPLELGGQCALLGRPAPRRITGKRKGDDEVFELVPQPPAFPPPVELLSAREVVVKGNPESPAPPPSPDPLTTECPTGNTGKLQVKRRRT
eukprot:TRINITY_DN11467_c0_g1_i1.p1 TRINITY_DN11467_c0_g1~~TRINITY_DN11467_c0_g1_i1.p1  ORF type:complete len:1456 (-),score=302.29 TRINITY_DN11467_c0_g1_i1:111-4478(-)